MRRQRPVTEMRHAFFAAAVIAIAFGCAGCVRSMDATINGVNPTERGPLPGTGPASPDSVGPSGGIAPAIAR
jgi:hypothetical protein